jgi:hypothetical protein
LRQRIFWTSLAVGLVALLAGIVWLAAVWSDDAARMDAAPYAGGLIIAGLLCLAWVASELGL